MVDARDARRRHGGAAGPADEPSQHAKRRYIDQIPTIEREVSKGNSIHEAFCRAGGYPVEFLDTLAVGEQTGKIVELMGLLARQYQERARSALATLTMLAGWVVWAAIAALLIALIFRVFSFYLGAINGALTR